MKELIDKWELINHEAEARRYSPEMLVIGKGHVLNAKVVEIDDRLDKAREELSEELDLAYEIFNEAFAKKNKTELEKKALHFAGMIMQTHSYLLDK